MSDRATISLPVPTPADLDLTLCEECAPGEHWLDRDGYGAIDALTTGSFLVHRSMDGLTVPCPSYELALILWVLLSVDGPTNYSHLLEAT